MKDGSDGGNESPPVSRWEYVGQIVSVGFFGYLMQVFDRRGDYWLSNVFEWIGLLLLFASIAYDFSRWFPKFKHWIWTIGSLMCFFTLAHLINSDLKRAPTKEATANGGKNQDNIQLADIIALQSFMSNLLAEARVQIRTNDYQPIVADPDLPGRSVNMLVAIEIPHEDRDCFIWDFGESLQRDRFSILLDRSGSLIFRVIDRDGQTSSVAAKPSLSTFTDGQPFYLSCELGTTQSHSTMAIIINGREVARRTINPPIQLHRSGTWRNVIGADLDKRNSGRFLLSTWIIYALPLSNEARASLLEDFSSVVNQPSLWGDFSGGRWLENVSDWKGGGDLSNGDTNTAPKIKFPKVKLPDEVRH